MKKLWITFLKDVKLSFNGLYFYIEVGMALIFILIMLFVVPEDFNQSQNLHLFLSDELSGFENRFDALPTLHDSKMALENALSEDRSAIGIALSIRENRMSYELILQGYESDALKDLMKTLIEGEALMTTQPELGIFERQLDLKPERLTDRQNILPIYLTMNVALMGLFIIAAYIFLDKDEGVIRAYAVTPVHIWQYLVSKMMIMAIMGIGTSIMVCLALVGTRINYPLLIGLVLVFNLFGSALGLLISSFFNTMIKAMGTLYAAIMILMFASISYFMPAFNPYWIKWFPSYAMLFSFRELLLVNGNLSYVYSTIGVFAIAGIVIFLIANWRFKKTLTI